MNENPEGTQNPLNPNPVPTATPAGSAAPATPVNPVAQSAQTAQPTMGAQPTASAMPVMQPAGTTTAQPTAPVNPINPPVQPTQPVQPTMAQTSGQAMDFMNPAPAAPVAQPTAPAMPEQPVVNDAAAAMAAAMAETEVMPTEQPVAKDSVVEPAGKAKKKTPLLIGIILIGIAVICGLAAVLIVLLNHEDDHVALALEQTFSADAATKIGVNGTITIQSDEENTLVPRVKIDLDGAIDTTTGANSAEATLTATLANESSMEFKLGEVKTEDGDTYIRVSGIQAALEGVSAGAQTCTTLEDGTEQCEAVATEECDEEGNCVSVNTTVDFSGVYEALLGMLGAVDGEWLRFPAATESETEDESGLDDVLDLSSSVCMVSTIGNLANYGATIGSLYTANPFITSSTDNVKITAKSANGMVYRLGVDNGKLANFTSALSSSDLGQDYRNCSGDTLPTMADVFYTVPPRIEVEIDKTSNRFTRVYFDATLEDEITSVTADLSFTYPGTVAVTEPTEYVDGLEMLTNMFSQFFNTEIIEGEVEVIPEEGAEITE